MNNSNDFLNEMKKLNPGIDDEVDAHAYAMSQVPLVKDFTWFGTVGNGVYYADSSEARWFPGLTPDEVSRLLAEEMI